MRYSPNSCISLRFNPGNDEDGAGASSIHSRSERSSWYMWAEDSVELALELMSSLLGPGEGWPIVTQVLGESL